MAQLHCIGCGGKLQNTDKFKPFYTPKSLEEDANLYCMRCFRMRNYGEIMPSYIDKEQYTELISQIPSEASLLKVIDVFDIEGSILPQISNLAQSDDLIIAANKRDLLPKSLKDARLKHRINAILQSYNLNAKSIVLMSAKKNQGIDSLMQTLFDEGKDIYVVGASNTGKSTLINHMISAAQNESVDPITTFFAPGTTQSFIEIPFGDHRLIDTPGLIKSNHYFSLLDEKTIKTLQPKKEIKPKSYQLEVNQTIFFGGLGRLDFIKGLPATFVFYMASNITLHRTKMINADDFFDKHSNALLTPAFKDKPDFKIHQFPLNYEKKMDIVIPGLGFITVKGSGVLRVLLPKGINPYYREALIG